MSEPEAYAAFPYPPDAHTATHPDRLATVARLHGIPAPDVETCRVLEIGCGVGGNIAAMAATLPRARFVGVDAIAGQIAAGRELLRGAGLDNVELHEGRIEELDDSLGTFDYVVAHGVFSWISREAQEDLFALIARTLAPNGVAYLSYVTQPGFQMTSILREAMLLKLHGITNPRERVRIARDQLDWLASNLPDGGPYGPAFAATLAEARAASNALLIHDWIAPHNTPIHFFRFAMRAERHGLAYLCEADPALAADHSPTPAGDAARARSPSELVFAEQLYDFLTNRRFRRTLVCRREAPPARVLDVHVVDSMYVSTRARPVDPDVDPKGDAPATFRSPEGEMTTNHVPTKLAMDLLVRATPGAMSFKEIERAVGDALGPADDAARGLEELRENLVTAFLSSSGVVELRAFAPPCVARAGERPAASPWARHLARTAHRVPNLRHEMVDLNEPVRRFLVKVDGTRDRAALVPELVLLANEGLLRDAAGQPARPGPKAVDEVLAQLARVALLMA